jgi:hypothetical protein
MRLQRHHIIAGLIAIVTALAFLLFYMPYLPIGHR